MSNSRRSMADKRVAIIWRTIATDGRLLVIDPKLIPSDDKISTTV